MPRRVYLPEPVAAANPSTAPPQLSPIVQKLRTDWRWAAISQFLWTFSDAFGFVDWDIELLENDLDGDETALLPDLLGKLLYALTYNRQINSGNVFEHLRKQYLKRFPADSPFGTLDEPIEWATLGLSRKVQTIWELCEWQLDDPAKFRALLPNEDESTAWRIDPIGWDKAGNTYFLFDDNRLWVQRLPPAPPRPPKKSSLKAKRALKRSRPKPKHSHKKRVSSRPPTPPPAKVEEPVSGPRKRTQVQFFGNVTPTVLALKRGGIKETPPTTRGTRSSDRLHSDSEAGPSTLPAATPSRTRTKAAASASTSKGPPASRGTRVSRRLRGSEDEWEQVPDDWLENGTEKKKSTRQTRRASGKGKKKAEDDESELSSLTDEEQHQAELEASHEQATSPVEEGLKVNGDDSEQLTPLPPSEQSEDLKVNGDDHSSANDSPASADAEGEDADADEDIAMKDERLFDGAKPEDAEDDAEGDDEETDEVKLAAKEADNLPEGFVEWEAICVTLHDWRTFPEQFKKSKHPDERALYTMLAQHVGPTVIEALNVKEQERLKQEAINNRKRSSRILARDLEKEEIMKREKAQREMEERMERQRREETRIAREEAELIARERAREDRLKEREERAAAREGAAAARLVADQDAKDQAVKDRESRKRRRDLGLEDWDDSSREGSRALTPARGKTPNGVSAKNGDDRWELNCEVCRKHGWNIDGDEDIVCCDDCGRWQHVQCHNRVDAAEGRPIRNWDKVDFKCKDCRRRAARKRQRLEEEARSAHGQTAPGPPPPPLQPGQYYLPHPPRGQPQAPPAGYAVYYPNSDGAAGPQPMMPYRPGQPQQPPAHHAPRPSQGPVPGHPPHAHSPHSQGPRPGYMPSPQSQPRAPQGMPPQGMPIQGYLSRPPHPSQPGLPQNLARGSPHQAHPSSSPQNRPYPMPSPQSQPHSNAYRPYQPTSQGSPYASHSPLVRPQAVQGPSQSPPFRPQGPPIVHGTVPHTAQHPFAPLPRPTGYGPQGVPPHRPMNGVPHPGQGYPAPQGQYPPRPYLQQVSQRPPAPLPGQAPPHAYHPPQPMSHPVQGPPMAMQNGSHAPTRPPAPAQASVAQASPASRPPNPVGAGHNGYPPPQGASSMPRPSPTAAPAGPPRPKPGPMSVAALTDQSGQ